MVKREVVLLPIVIVTVVIIAIVGYFILTNYLIQIGLSPFSDDVEGEGEFVGDIPFRQRTCEPIEISDGDPYFNQNPIQPEWVWNLGNLNQFTLTSFPTSAPINPWNPNGPYIGIENSLSYPPESPRGIGEGYSLPDNYAGVGLEGLTVPISGYSQLVIELDSVLVPVPPCLPGDVLTPEGRCRKVFLAGEGRGSIVNGSFPVLGGPGSWERNWNVARNSNFGWVADEVGMAAGAVNYGGNPGMPPPYNENMFGIARAFLPFDTSSLPSDLDIIRAELVLHYAVSENNEGDENSFIVIVQTNQQDINQLSSFDYPRCGAVNSPVEGSERFSLAYGYRSLGTFTIPLNTRGISFIERDGWTKLGIRGGHDVTNDPLSGRREPNEAILVYLWFNALIQNRPELWVYYTPFSSSLLRPAIKISTSSVAPDSYFRIRDDYWERRYPVQIVGEIKNIWLQSERIDNSLWANVLVEDATGQIKLIGSFILSGGVKEIASLEYAGTSGDNLVLKAYLQVACDDATINIRADSSGDSSVPVVGDDVVVARFSKDATTGIVNSLGCIRGVAENHPNELYFVSSNHWWPVNYNGHSRTPYGNIIINPGVTAREDKVVLSIPVDQVKGNVKSRRLMSSGQEEVVRNIIPLGEGVVVGDNYNPFSRNEMTVNYNRQTIRTQDLVTFNRDSPSLETSLTLPWRLNYEENVFTEAKEKVMRYYYAFEESVDLNRLANYNPLEINFLGQDLKFVALVDEDTLLLDAGECTFCGDNVINPPREQCDGTNLGGYTCSSLFRRNLQGNLRCFSPGTPYQCQFDISQCRGCGNGIVERSPDCGTGSLDPTQLCEECDDGNLDPNDQCSNDCKLTYCGDGIVQSPNGRQNLEEECDGTGASCQELSGGFICTGFAPCDQCEYDRSDCNCTYQPPPPPLGCGNGVCEPGETCENCYPDCRRALQCPIIIGACGQIGQPACPI